MVQPRKWLRPDMVPPAPFLQCMPHLTPGSSGVWADPARVDEVFDKLGFPSFAVLGKGKLVGRNSTREQMVGCTFLNETSLPPLIGEVLAEVVRRKGATAGDLHGWEWREMKVFPAVRLEPGRKPKSTSRRANSLPGVGAPGQLLSRDCRTTRPPFEPHTAQSTETTLLPCRRSTILYPAEPSSRMCSAAPRALALAAPWHREHVERSRC